MLTKQEKNKARNEARKLLREFNLRKIPLDLVSLLHFLDLQYKPFEPGALNLENTSPEKISAFIIYSENTIFYNPMHTKNRIRFSVAHEVGHYQLGHRSIPHPTDYDASEPKELLANIFAAEILIPYEFIIKEKIQNKDDIRTLANKYRVSKKAMFWRILKSDRLLESKFDYLQPKPTYTQFDYSDLYPPNGFEDISCEDAVNFYKEVDEDDLKATCNWIKKNEEEDSFPEAYEALLDVISDLD